MRNSSTRDPSIHQCQLCYRYHSLRFCRRFLDMDSNERNKTARRYNYCVNCFARTHNVYSCDSPDTCMYCGQLHHTLLHPNRRPRAAIARRSVHDRLGHRHQSPRITRRSTESTARSHHNANRNRTSIDQRRSTHQTIPRRINKHQRPITKNNNIAPRVETSEVTPNQRILSEAIRSLAVVLCATSPNN